MKIKCINIIIKNLMLWGIALPLLSSLNLSAQTPVNFTYQKQGGGRTYTGSFKYSIKLTPNKSSVYNESSRIVTSSKPIYLAIDSVHRAYIHVSITNITWDERDRRAKKDNNQLKISEIKYGAEFKKINPLYTTTTFSSYGRKISLESIEKISGLSKGVFSFSLSAVVGNKIKLEKAITTVNVNYSLIPYRKNLRISSQYLFDEWAWELATMNNSLSAYRKYLKRSGTKRFTQSSTNTIKKLEAKEKFAFKDAFNSKNPKELNTYLKNYPPNIYSNKSRIDSIGMLLVEADSIRIAQAEKEKEEEEAKKRQIDSLKHENYWQEKNDYPSISGYESYLELYPDGIYVNYALAEIERLRKLGLVIEKVFQQNLDLVIWINGKYSKNNLLQPFESHITFFDPKTNDETEVNKEYEWKEIQGKVDFFELRIKNLNLGEHRIKISDPHTRVFSRFVISEPKDPIISLKHNPSANEITILVTDGQPPFDIHIRHKWQKDNFTIRDKENRQISINYSEEFKFNGACQVELVDIRGKASNSESFEISHLQDPNETWGWWLGFSVLLLLGGSAYYYLKYQSTKLETSASIRPVPNIRRRKPQTKDIKIGQKRNPNSKPEEKLAPQISLDDIPKKKYEIKLKRKIKERALIKEKITGFTKGSETTFTWILDTNSTSKVKLPLIKYDLDQISDPRDRALAKNHMLLDEFCSRSGRISYEILENTTGNIPEAYKIIYRVKSIIGIKVDNAPIYGEKHEMKVRFPIGFPIPDGPFFKMTTDVWHPNIEYSGPRKGRICVLNKAFDQWHSLDTMVYHIGEMLQYKSYLIDLYSQQAVNPQAETWITKYGKPQNLVDIDSGLYIDDSELLIGFKTAT